MISRLSSTLARSTSPNKAIIDLLSRCLKEEDSSPTRNAYKVRSFQVAIAAIHQHNKPISSGNDAIKIRGIGLGIANRIDFFLQDKEYDEGLNAQARARLLAIETFQKIPGIGERTATNLVNAGAASVSDLRLPGYAALLTPTQKIGVRYGDQLTRPVSRAEAEEIATFIRDHISGNFEVHLTGAYRRESTDLPQVTILLHHPQYVHVTIPPPPPYPSTAAAAAAKKSPVRTRGRQHVPFLQVNTSAAERRASPLLQDVVRPLNGTGLLAATIASSTFKWRGVSLLPLRAHADAGSGANVNNTPGGAWQEVGDRLMDIRATRGKYVRLDLSLAPFKSRGAAQIIMTGDEEFVRIARLAAARHGMYLDEYGLWRWHSSEEAALESQSQFQPQSNANATAEMQEQRNGSGAAAAGYWELVEGESEDRILDELELASIAPHRRNFRFLTSRKRASARAGTLDYSSATAFGEEDLRWRRRKNGVRERQHQDEDGDVDILDPIASQADR